MTWQTLTKHLKKKDWYFDKFYCFVSADQRPNWFIQPNGFYPNKYASVSFFGLYGSGFNTTLPYEFVEEYIDLMERVRKHNDSDTDSI